MKPPLHGLKLVEFEGIRPAPLCGRILAGMGAEARPTKGAVQAQLAGGADQEWNRGKRILPLDLKDPVACQQAFELVSAADALIEGNRPGVMERLRLGSKAFSGRHPKLVYGRMTGWGQDGPLAMAAGHDLNYVALTGVLALSAHRETYRSFCRPWRVTPPGRFVLPSVLCVRC